MMKTVQPFVAIQADQEVRLNGFKNSGREVINQVATDELQTEDLSLIWKQEINFSWFWWLKVAQFDWKNFVKRIASNKKKEKHTKNNSMKDIVNDHYVVQT